MSKLYFPETYFPGEKGLAGEEPKKGISRRDLLKIVAGAGFAVAGAKALERLLGKPSAVELPSAEKGGVPLQPTIAPLAESEATATPLPEVQPKTEASWIPEIPWMPETVQRWYPKIAKVCEQYQVNSNLISIMMLVESAGNFAAVSRSGALGLMQVMYFHSKGRNLFIPETNIKVGVDILVKEYQEHNQDWDKAIAGYYGQVKNGKITSTGESYLGFVNGMLQEADTDESPTFERWTGNRKFIRKAEQLYENETRLKAVKFATKQWHKSYLLGGDGPDRWDCSGLVQAAYRHAGIEISGTATAQWQGVGRVLSNEDEILPSDLVFFTRDGSSSDHVGMIIFQPDVFIEATALTETVKISSLNSKHDLYRDDLAKRVLGFKRLT